MLSSAVCCGHHPFWCGRLRRIPREPINIAP